MIIAIRFVFRGERSGNGGIVCMYECHLSPLTLFV